jgi:hypothetical protein
MTSKSEWAAELPQLPDGRGATAPPERPPMTPNAVPRGSQDAVARPPAIRRGHVGWTRFGEKMGPG